MSCSIRSTTWMNSSSRSHELQVCCIILHVITTVFGVEFVFPASFLSVIARKEASRLLKGQRDDAVVVVVYGSVAHCCD